MNQSQLLRKLSGIQRLEQAFKISDFTLELAKMNICEQLDKKVSPKRITKELNKRLSWNKY